MKMPTSTSRAAAQLRRHRCRLLSSAPVHWSIATHRVVLLGEIVPASSTAAFGRPRVVGPRRQLLASSSGAVGAGCLHYIPARPFASAMNDNDEGDEYSDDVDADADGGKKNMVAERGNRGMGAAGSATMEEKELEELARRLLSQRPSEEEVATTEDDGDRTSVNDMRQELLNNVQKLVRYYSSDDRPRRIIAVVDSSAPADAPSQLQTQAHQPQMRRTLSGPEVCASLLRTCVLPSDGLVISETQLDLILEMYALTIASLARSCRSGGKRRGPSRASEHATMAEHLLRTLLSSKVRRGKKDEDDRRRRGGDDGDHRQHDRKRRMSTPTASAATKKKRRSLNLSLNSALDAWSKAAQYETDGPRSRKDAAQRAERLLVEVAQRRRIGFTSEAEEEAFAAPFLAVDGKRLGESEEGAEVEALSQLVRPDTISFNTVLTAWSRCGDRGKSARRNGDAGSSGAVAAAERAEAILRLMQELADDATAADGEDDRYGIRPNKRSYEATIEAWARASPSGDAPSRAVAILTDMIKRHNASMRSVGGLHEDKHSSRPLEPFPGTRTFTVVLNAFKESKSPTAPAEADALFATMEDYGKNWHRDVMPNAYTFNTLIMTHAKVPVTSPSEMKQRCLRIDELVHRLEEYEDENGASYFAGNQDQNDRGRFAARPDATTYGTAVNAWSRCAKMMTRPPRLSGRQHPRDESRKKALTCALQAEKHLRSMLDLGLASSSPLAVHAFNDVIHAYALAGSHDKAEEVFLLARDAHYPSVKVNTASYQNVIEALSHGSFLDPSAAGRAENYLMEMERRHHEEGVTYIRPDTYTYNNVLSGWAQSRDQPEGIRRADFLLSHLVNRYEEGCRRRPSLSDEEGRPPGELMNPIRPNTSSFLVVMSGLVREGIAFDRVEELVHKMESMHEDWRQLRTGSAEFKAAAHIIPNVVAYNIVLDAYAKMSKSHGKGAVEKAEALIHRMKKFHRSGVNPRAKPDKYSFASLAAIYAHSGINDAGSKCSRLADQLLDLGSSEGSKVGATKGAHGKAGGTSQYVDGAFVNTVLNALLRSNEPGSAQQAADLLSKVENSGLDFVLDKVAYTTVISAWAREGTYEAAQKAEALLNRLDDKYKNAVEQNFKRAEADLKPDTFAYNALISGYAKSRTHEGAQRAEELLRKMEELYRGGDEYVKPDTISFNAVMDGWGRVVSIGAEGMSPAQRAEDILKHMTRLHQAGYEGVKPNNITFSTALQAWIRSEEPGSHERAEALLLKKIHSEDENIFANHIDYNTVIKKWGSREDEVGLEHALDLFELMLRRCEEKSSHRAWPDSTAVNLILHMYAKIRQDGAAQKAQDLFDRMEKWFREKKRGGLDKISYVSCMDAWVRSREEGSPEKAAALLDRMIKEGKKCGSGAQLRPDIDSFNLVLKGCSMAPSMQRRRSAERSEQDKSDPLGVAIKIFGDLRGPNEFAICPSHATFSYMFLICDKHMARDDPRRAELFGKLFQQCCRDGLLSSFSLATFRQAVPRSFFVKMISAAGGPDLSERGTLEFQGIPFEWRRNVAPSTKPRQKRNR